MKQTGLPDWRPLIRYPERKMYFAECRMRNFEKVYFAKFYLRNVLRITL